MLQILSWILGCLIAKKMGPRKLRKNLTGFYFDLHRSVLDHGLLSGRDDYCKFILIGRSRSGSTLLKSALASHRQVMMFGELFRNPGQIGWNSNFGRESDRTHELAFEDPTTFLCSRVYRTYPKHIHAVGFKIFYYHAKKNNWNQVWTYLTEQKDLHIIHIKRRNILEVQLSAKRARKTGRWADKGNRNEDDHSQLTSPIDLDYEKLVQWFNLTRNWENETDSTFNDHPKIDVYYEDLTQNYTAEIDRIQKFLYLDKQTIEPATRKQAKGKLSEQISNYAELKTRFKDTPWIEFFED